MEKMKMESVDMTAQNIDKIGELFPNCITETIDESGKPKKAVNFELLKQMLSNDAVEGNEKYEFTWVGKKASIMEANKPIRKTLRPCPNESVDWDNTKNLYIEGDNLEALKLLQESYLNKVKMIYIDPPYNTGNDFIYNDDFKMSNQDYLLETGELDEMGDKMFINTDSNGRFHSDWCSMMFSRLMLSRNLLSDDGVIFISIDGHELETLELMCDEVFSKPNYVGTLILQTATDNNPTQINEEHEYMVCYAKNISALQPWYRASESANKIQKQYEKIKANEYDVNKIQEKLREWIKENKEELSQVSHYNYVDEKGVYSASSNSSNPHPGGYMYDILHFKTKLPCPKPANGWRWPEKTFLQYENNGEVHWGNDHTTQPHIKKRLSTAKEQLKSVIYEDNRSETKMLAQLFDGEKVFDNPKPHSVLKEIIDFATTSDDVILDFFSGSATIAHSVFLSNLDQNFQRKFILVQLKEEINPNKETSEGARKTAQNAIKILDKLNRPHNICEIGKERIRRVGTKIKEENPLFAQNLDIGFRVFKVDSSNMKDVYYSAGEYNQDILLNLESNIKEDRNDLDLLFGCLLEWGLPLSLPYSSEEIGGCTVHNYNDGDLIACFNDNVPDSVIKEIANKKPLRAVFRDSCFENSPSKINVGEIFKLLSPDTRVKVI